MSKRREASRRAGEHGSRSAGAAGDRAAGGGGTDLVAAAAARSVAAAAAKLGGPPILEAGEGGLTQWEVCERVWLLSGPVDA
jgi:hypothetical protein